MGICPCRRDADPEEKKETLRTKIADDSSLLGEAAEEELRLVGRLGPSYCIKSLLRRQGSMTVYRAQHLSTQQLFTIKQIPKGRFRFPTQAKAHLFKTLSKLDHPNVVKTFEVCDDDQTITIITELYDGGDLQEYLEAHGHVSQACTAEVLQQVLSALAYSHNLGVTHKTLNLTNIVLKEPAKVEHMSVKVMGFEGFELSRGDKDRVIDCFMAPEVATGEVSEKCDIWSCGVILFILLSGERPFEKSRPIQSRKRTYHLFFAPDKWTHVSEDVITLITSMLSLRASDRPSALKCLSHPWLQQSSRTLSLSSKPVAHSLSQLRTRASCSALQETVTLYLINRVMKSSEIMHLTQIFTALDRNGDGVISRDELIDAFKTSMTPERAQQEADRILEKIDRNQNGSIEYTEFLLKTVAEHKLLSRDNMRIAFASLDTDGNGSISQAELKEFFKANTSPELDCHWKSLMAEFVGTEGADIDFATFERIMFKLFKS